MSDARNSFNDLADLVMADPSLSAMRPVVEKELLLYEIFHALDADGLLKDIVFQGGTSLRLCRGSDRFSEDLDFAGGTDFSAEGMGRIKACVERRVGNAVKDSGPRRLLGLFVSHRRRAVHANEDRLD